MRKRRKHLRETLVSVRNLVAFEGVQRKDKNSVGIRGLCHSRGAGVVWVCEPLSIDGPGNASPAALGGAQLSFGSTQCGDDIYTCIVVGIGCHAVHAGGRVAIEGDLCAVGRPTRANESRWVGG